MEQKWSSCGNQTALFKCWQKRRAFCRLSCRTRTETITNLTTTWPRLLDYMHLLPPAPVLPLFKPNAHISTPKTDMGSVESFISSSSHCGHGNKPLCFSPFLVSLNLHKGRNRWPSLTCWDYWSLGFYPKNWPQLWHIQDSQPRDVIVRQVVSAAVIKHSNKRQLRGERAHWTHNSKSITVGKSRPKLNS